MLTARRQGGLHPHSPARTKPWEEPQEQDKELDRDLSQDTRPPLWRRCGGAR